jgi:hypothetical protein
MPMPPRQTGRTGLSPTRGIRRGAITVFAAVLIVLMLIVVAFAIDIGMLCVAKAELQRSADAAALAATEELLHQSVLRAGQAAGGSEDRRRDSKHLSGEVSVAVRDTAASYAELNEVGRSGPELERNFTNDKKGEIVIGEMVRSDDGSASLSLKDASRYNSVIVRVKRSAERNGEVSLFFGRLMGRHSVAAAAQAQAAFLQDFRGFRIPPGDPPPTLMVLPFAVHRGAWQKAIAGAGTDEFAWDRNGERVVSGSDGVPEINLYPLETGANGNFGTVDIGSDNSNTPTLRRQIVEGVTREDLEFHGGELALNENGKLILSGDPGLKAGAIEPALQSIIGETRIIPLYSSARGSGQHAQFTIVGFAGGRIVEAQLTGGTRSVKLQPAPIITRGGITGGRSVSTHIFSPVKLVD